MTLVSMIGQKKKKDNLGYTWRFPTQGWHRTTFFSLFSCCQVFNIPQDIGTQFYNHMDSINFMSSFGGFLAPTKPPTRNLTAIRSWTVRRWKMMKTMLSDPGNLAYFQGRTVKLQGRREFFQSAPAKPSQDGFWSTFLGYKYWIPHSQLTFFYLTLHLFFLPGKIPKMRFYGCLTMKIPETFHNFEDTK